MTRLFAPLLILSLLLSSFATASARGAMAGTLDMVICTGKGMITISMDGNGDPVESRETCPDCVMTLAVPVPASVQLPRLVSTAQMVQWTAPRSSWTQRHSLPAVARGPPALV